LSISKLQILLGISEAFRQKDTQKISQNRFNQAKVNKYILKKRKKKYELFATNWEKSPEFFEERQLEIDNSNKLVLLES
jgi:hypothetical protein